MKKIFFAVTVLLTFATLSVLFCKPVKNAFCRVLPVSIGSVLKQQCLLAVAEASDSVLIPVSRNLTAAQPLLADTSKSLPVTSLKCALAPSSSLVVNVKEQGAKGDGVNNDTAAIQAAVELVKNTGGTVLVPAGTYMIDAVSHIHLRDHMTFKMEPGAVLKAIPNNQEVFSVIKINKVTDVNVIGGIIQGERNAHQGKSGEWGMGLEVNGANNVVIEKVIAKDNWGDGFYVSENATNTVFCDVVADNNRRQGMSVVSADGIIIKDSFFQRTNGYLPMSGLDVEPNTGNTVNNVQVIGSQFLQNKGNGILFSMPTESVGVTFVKNGLIDGNLIANNGTPGDYFAGIMFYYQQGIKISNNVVKNNLQDGISINTGSSENNITGNTIVNNGRPDDKKYGRGIFIYRASKNLIENNTVTNNIKYDIHDHPADNILKNNQAKKIKLGPAF